jgi:Uma2 family endonuclease
MNLAKKQEYFTYEDYLTWDTDERYELIDGVPFLMSPAPTTTHQSILVKLTSKFFNYLDDKSCKVFIAPVDVRLNPEGADDTVVQPDLIVVCDESKISKRGIDGAPDLALEILSPSSADYDKGTKLEKYLDSGVREYWIVDPEEESVRVYIRSADANFKINKYSNEDVIPVEILDGLTIKMKEIF